jgi:hypothetical protein
MAHQRLFMKAKGMREATEEEATEEESMLSKVAGRR